MWWHVRAMAVALLVTFAASTVASAQTPGRTERIQFEKGASSATVKGNVRGDAFVDHRIRASAGQTLKATLLGSNTQNYFNVLPPGSVDVAMFVGQVAGASYEGVLPTDGDYTIRVYLMRAAARRNETSNYVLTVEVTGAPLAPVPASKDALIPGTPFHASASVSCVPPYSAKAQQCEAFVIRRSFNGTATVEVRGPKGLKRVVLFVSGKPVASDSMEAMTFSRADGGSRPNATIVKFGTEERYDIPEELLTGG